MDASSASGSMSVSSMCSHQDARKSSACGRPRTTSSRRMPRPVVRWSAPRGSPWVRSLASWSRVLQLRQSLLFLMMLSMTSRVVTRENVCNLISSSDLASMLIWIFFWYWLVLFLFAGCWCYKPMWLLLVNIKDFAMVDCIWLPSSYPDCIVYIFLVCLFVCPQMLASWAVLS